MSKSANPVGQPSQRPPGEQSAPPTRVLTPVDPNSASPRPGAPRRNPQIAILVLLAIVVLIAGSALVATRLGRERPFFVGTPTTTPPPELAFFPAPPRPDQPQDDQPLLPPVQPTTAIVIAAATPAPDTTSAPIATPTAGADLLAPARQAQYEGRYEDAAALYRELAASHNGDAVGADAQWYLGVVLYDSGEYDDSVASFRSFAGTYASDARAVRAAFWAAQGHAAAGRPAEALAEFESYAAQSGPLQVTALLLAADAAGADGQPSRQRDLLQKALAANPTRLDRVSALERLALLDEDEDRWREAGDEFMQVADAARVNSYRAYTLLKAARAYYEANDNGKAEETLLGLITSLPDDPSSYSGLELLLDHNSTALESGRLGYDVACRSAVAVGQYTVGIGYCETFRENTAPGPARADAAWYTAVAYDKLDNAVQAATWYQGFAEVYPADERADDALLAWGNTLLDEGDNPGAVVLFDRLVANYPVSPLVGQAQDGAGVALRRNGDLAGAAERWRLAAAAPGVATDERARALFWQGWALQQQGLAADAAQVWTEGSTLGTFWGFRCADHLNGATVVPTNPGPADAVDLTDAIPDSADAAALFGWLAAWNKGAAHDAASARIALLQDPEYARALALSRVEMWSDANSQYDALVANWQANGDGGMLAALLLEASREGWPWISYRAALGLRAAATAAGVTTSTTALPAALRYALYPAPWPGLLAQSATERNVDPLLLLAMMRQESAFDPRAHSWADARGLLQVVPATASGIAIGLGMTDFSQAQLFRPTVAIRFGAVYIADALKQFDGNILSALAGYNGGPGNVPRWSGGLAAGDPDLFIENIDYPETLEYLQLVYSNYRTYGQIYAP